MDGYLSASGSTLSHMVISSWSMYLAPKYPYPVSSSRSLPVKNESGFRAICPIFPMPLSLHQSVVFFYFVTERSRFLIITSSDDNISSWPYISTLHMLEEVPVEDSLSVSRYVTPSVSLRHCKKLCVNFLRSVDFHIKYLL